MSATASCSFPFLNEWKHYCDKNRICAFIDSVLSGYAQLAFNDNTFSGILMIIATWVGSPVLCINALWGTVIATITAYIIHIPEGAIRSGSYGFNAALSCLAVPVLLFPSQSISVVMLGTSAAIAIATVLFKMTLGKIFAKWNLPTLVIPYCIALLISMMIFEAVGVTDTTPVTMETLLFTSSFSDWVANDIVLSFLSSAAQILWLAHPVSGALYLISLLFASRMDFINTAAAITVSLFVSTLLGLPKDGIMIGLYGYNAILLMQVLSRGFLLNIRSFLFDICMAALTPVICCIYQCFLTSMHIGSFIALPYLTIAIFVFAIRKKLKGFTYISADDWGVPETISQKFK